MITITSTSNKSITVVDDVVNTTHILQGVSCAVITQNQQYDHFTPIRILKVYNVYNGGLISVVNTNTLGTGSTSYDSNMDTYAANLIAILYA